MGLRRSGTIINSHVPNQSSSLIREMYAPEIAQGIELQNQYNAGDVGDVAPIRVKSSLEAKPIMEEVNKVPVLDQLDLIKKQIDINNLKLRQNPALGLPPSAEEKRQEMLKFLREEDLKKGQEYV